MTVSLHSAAVSQFLQILPQMAALVDKAEAHCAEKGLAPEALLGTKLADDMWPLAGQLKACWMHSADAIDALLSGTFSPDFSPPPADFASFRSKLHEAITRLQIIRPADVDAAENNDVALVLPNRRLEFTGKNYILGFAMPNFYFHSSMVYAILRSQGLPIGKGDFIGALPLKG